ncbi:MAG: DUF4384 domain-containing protein [Synechococcales cyanobacterium CRU_2_2]|nr:DUF4384 domain-containing protein [Synechococcales cyanobacterium CRU_2_2]
MLSVRSSSDISLWLGGLPSQAIAYCASGAIFQVISEPSQASGKASNLTIPGSIADEVPSRTPASLDPASLDPVRTVTVTPTIRYLQIQQRSGLQAQAKLYRMGEGSGLPAVGALVREQVRVIPRKIDLAIAIDKRLDRIERVDATSALTAIPRVAVVTTRHEPADYVFGRVAPRGETLVASLPQNLRQHPSPVDLAQTRSTSPVTELEELELPGSEYGLLTLSHEVLLPTLGASSEAIKTAIQRLQPYLETLRAAKKFQLLENSLTTQLAVQSRWERLPALSDRANPSQPPILAAPRRAGCLSLRAGDRLQYQLKNESDRPLYALVLGFDPRGRWKPWVTDNLISPLTPALQAQGSITLGKRPGLTDLYTVFSLSPFDRMYELFTGGRLQNSGSPGGSAHHRSLRPF